MLGTTPAPPPPPPLHEIPLPAAAKIAGYLAFDTTRVDLIEGVKV